VTGERVAAAHMSPAAIPELIFRAMADIVPPVCTERWEGHYRLQPCCQYVYAVQGDIHLAHCGLFTFCSALSERVGIARGKACNSLRSTPHG
jgi:hypothetical protein